MAGQLGLIALSLTLCLALLDLPLARAEEAVRFGYSGELFRSVQRSDAEAATHVWANVVMGRQVIQRRPVVTIFEDAASLETAIARSKTDVIIMPSVTYLTTPHRKLVVPMFTGVRHGGVGEQYILLARAKGGPSSLDGLRGRDIVIDTGGRGELPRMWLDVALRSSGASTCGKHFGSVKRVPKPSQAVLPVFFRQADCCLVTRSGFDTMRELNPQLGRSLRVLKTSPRLQPGIICFHSNWKDTRAAKIAMEEALGGLQEYPEGRHIMTLFGVQRLVPFKPEHVDAVADLVAECRKRGISTVAGQ